MTHPLNRRTFVGASIAVGGAATATSLLAGCGEEERAAPSGPTTAVTLTINGEERTIDVDNRTSLLDMLRERAGLPGTKNG